MPTKKKRAYTFRKDKIIPYQSGSIIHMAEKMEREAKKKKSWF